MTKQDAFDKAVTTVLGQGALAKQTSPVEKCFYRTDKQHRCNIGALIPDNMYTPEIENSVPFRGDGLGALALTGIIAKLGFTREDEDWLFNLQKSHDTAEDLVDYFKNMANFAAGHNLNTDAMNNWLVNHQPKEA